MKRFTRGGHRRYFAASFVLLLLLAGCGAKNDQAFETINLAPMQWLAETGDVVRLPAPLHTFDARYRYTTPSEAGGFTTASSAVTLFPTLVWIVSDPTGGTPKVFLARSPHLGCLIEWNQQEQRFDDPCHGSRFDRSGRWEFGPSPRDMDRLPAEVRDGFLWVTNQIIYGDPVP